MHGSNVGKDSALTDDLRGFPWYHQATSGIVPQLAMATVKSFPVQVAISLASSCISMYCSLKEGSYLLNKILISLLLSDKTGPGYLQLWWLVVKEMSWLLQQGE